MNLTLQMTPCEYIHPDHSNIMGEILYGRCVIIIRIPTFSYILILTTQQRFLHLVVHHGKKL